MKVKIKRRCKRVKLPSSPNPNPPISEGIFDATFDYTFQ